MGFLRNIYNLIFTQRQCETGLDLGKMGRIYCVRKNGHFGKCRAYNGRVLEGNIKKFPIEENNQ